LKRRYPHSRFVGFAVLLALVMSALLVRLAWIQIVTQDHWEREATIRTSQRIEVPPRRGAILDRNRNPLAFSEKRVRVGVTDPARWAEGQPLNSLSDWLGLDARRLQRKLRGQRGHVVLRRGMALPPALADSLRRHPTITVEPYHVRTYPMGNLGMRLLGHVAEHGHGDAGIEQLCDDILAGTPGLVLERYSGGAHRDPIMRIPQVAPVDGRDVVLTLDYRVQMILEEELEKARRESEATDALAIVLDPNTAEVVALAEVPLLEDEDRSAAPPAAWRCRSIADVFEPGSTFKLFTLASLLSHGVCDTATVFDGEGHPDQYRSAARVRGALIHDVHPVGRVSLRHAFTVSSNIVMAKAVSSYLRPNELHESLLTYGFGAKTGCGWPGETPGLLHPPTSWSRRTQPTLAIGQEIGVNLMQMAVGYAALVTDGTLRSPLLVRSWRDEKGRSVTPPSNVARRGVVPPAVIPILRELCRGVVNESYGTGANARVEGLSVAGKTGTGQISTSEGYLADEFTASFVGFVPAEKPQLLAAIILRGAKGRMRWGGEAPARCFANTMRQVLVSTDWLDEGAVVVDEPRVELKLPDLLGQQAAEVMAVAESGKLLVEPQAPSRDARVVGQMPPPGTLVREGTRVHLAWAGGQP
jgi:cell division protein FtsI/penicillin-binding protein 2